MKPLFAVAAIAALSLTLSGCFESATSAAPGPKTPEEAKVCDQLDKLLTDQMLVKWSPRLSAAMTLHDRRGCPTDKLVDTVLNAQLW